MKGRLNPDRPKVPELRALVRQIYSDNCVGCCLHIVTDDFNFDRASVEFCLGEARKAGHELCRRAAEMMLLMTKTQIAKASRGGR